jgi:hypothetical protein
MRIIMRGYLAHTGIPDEQDMPAPVTITIFFALLIASEILRRPVCIGPPGIVGVELSFRVTNTMVGGYSEPKENIFSLKIKLLKGKFKRGFTPCRI